MAWAMWVCRAVVKLSGLWVTARIVPHMSTPFHSSRPRTVLVTGAARRLGRSIALALAAGGWQVAVHYRSSQQDAIDTVAACASLTSASAHFDADFEDEASVRTLLPRVIEHFGERELFNDSWRGEGCCVYAETPHPNDHSGLFGRGLQGLLDTFLQIFYI